MYRFAALVVVTVVCASIALGLQACMTSKEQPPGRAETRPAPSGRTLDDVRSACTPPLMKGRGAASQTHPAPPPPPRPAIRIIEANVFAVTDPQGNVRAELGASDTEAKMQMFDDQGKPRLVLMEKHGVATVTLVGEDGRAGLELRLTPDGRAEITIGPRDAKTAAPLALQAGPSVDPAILLRNEAGDDVASLSSHQQEGGIVEVRSAKATGRLQPGGLQLWTPDGGPRAGLGLLNGNPQLNMSRGGGTKTELELGCAGEVSWLTLNTAGFGSARLAAADYGSSVTLRPAGGEGEAYLGSSHKDGQSAPRLHLGDGGSGRVYIQTEAGRPSIYLFDAEGKPALFSAP